jgi:hypothetical protein
MRFDAAKVFLPVKEHSNFRLLHHFGDSVLVFGVDEELAGFRELAELVLGDESQPGMVIVQPDGRRPELTFLNDCRQEATEEIARRKASLQELLAQRPDGVQCSFMRLQHSRPASFR